MNEANTDPSPFQVLATPAALVVLCTFVLLATFSSLIFPIFEAPDEYSHFQYARLLAQGKGLPIQTDPERRAHSEGFNPPLPYLAPALVLALFDPDNGAGISLPPDAEGEAMARLADTWTGVPPINPNFRWWGRGSELNFFEHPPGQAPASGPLLYANLMRLTSILYGLFTLIGVLLLAQEVFPERPQAQIGTLIFVAFNPQFVYLSGSLNSDNLVTTFAAWVLWRLAALLRKPQATPRDVVLLGLLLGLGTLAKTNMLFLVAPTVVVLWLRSGGWRPAVRNIATVAGIMIVVGGWFFARNAWLYGGWDFLGWKTRAALETKFLIGDQQRQHFLTFVLRELLPTVYSSFWGWFGWLTVRMYAWQYAFYKALGLLALLSLWELHPSRRTGRSGAVLLAWSCLALNLASLVSFNLTFLAHQGRLIFPSIGAVGLLLGVGLNTLLAQVPSRWAWPIVSGIALVLVTQILYIFKAIVVPIYLGT